MRTLFKILAWTFASILVLLVAGVLAVGFLFDPNDYKDEIVTAVKSSTGRDLTIAGDIGWTLWPRLGVALNALELSNAPGFGKEPFASVRTATASVEVLPLLKRQINIDAVIVDGLTLNLAKNAAGKTNWDDMVAAGKKDAPAEKKDDSEKTAPSNMAFGVGKLDVRNANLTWHDQGSGDRYAVRNFTLLTGRLALGKPIDLTLSLDLEHGKPVQRVPLKLQATVTQGTDRLGLKPFTLELGDSKLSGNVEVLNLANPAYRFALALDQFDLDVYLPPATPDTTSEKSADDAAEPVLIPVGLLRALDIDGKLTIGKLKAFGIRSENIATQVVARAGAIQIGPSSAKLYGGTYSGNIGLDVRGKIPQLKLDENLKQVQLGPFLKEADLFDHFSGAGNVALKLTAAGGDAAQIKRTLNGNVSVAINEGAVEGIDLVKIENQIKDARKEAGKDLKKLAAAIPELKPVKGDKTTFSKLGATAVVTNGIVSNKDLTIEGPHLHVRGSGKVDLVRDIFDDYVLHVSDIPLHINGPLAAPKIRPDLGTVAKKAASEKIEKKKKEVGDKLKEKLRKKLGN
jgi:AsmA protein